jgi:phage baseplate assembly protein W
MAELHPVINGLNSIKQGLERLLTTPKGHNPFNRDYGSSLYELLFENNVNLSSVQMFLYMDLTKWEPRINLSPNDIYITQIDSNTYSISCNFVAVEYDATGNISTTITRE